MGYLNPLLRLPAGRALLELPTADRLRIAKVMRELRVQANSEAEKSWGRRKGFAAAYWRAVSTYARHVAHALTRKPERHEKADTDVGRLLLDLERARLDVELLLDGARRLLPEGQQPEGADARQWARAMKRRADQVAHGEAALMMGAKSGEPAGC